MDPLAHTLFGAALAKTRLGRSTAFGTATLVIGANLPDVDVLAYARGADFALGFRRGWTHGVAALVVLPLLLWAAVLVYDRLIRRIRARSPPASTGRLLFLSIVAVWSHPALDWLNNYGMRWLMPFDGTWFYGDTLFIVDPWLWLGLGGVVWLGGPGRRVRMALAIAAGLATVLLTLAPVPTPAKVLWMVGLASIVLLARAKTSAAATWRARMPSILVPASILYIVAMLVTAGLARKIVFEEIEARGIGPVRAAMVGPVAVDPLRRDVVVATDREYHHGFFDWRRRPHLVLAAETLPKPPATPVIEAALGAPGLQGLVDWARFPFVEIDDLGDAYRVFLLDARYTRTRTNGFGGGSVVLRKGDLKVVDPD